MVHWNLLDAKRLLDLSESGSLNLSNNLLVLGLLSRLYAIPNFPLGQKCARLDLNRLVSSGLTLVQDKLDFAIQP